MIRETEKFSVLNYNESRVSTMVSPTEHYGFEPSQDGITPTVIPMTADQIRYANNSNAFKSGLLFFEKNKEKEIYEEILNISNWQDILRNNDIKDILLRPTYDGLQKILKIKDIAAFERVRAALHKLKNEGDHDISVRVVQIVDARYRELQDKKVNTSIILEKKDIPVRQTEEVEALRAENKAMQEQMLQMQKMMEQLLKQTADKAEEPKENATSKKTPSRQKKTVE